MFLANRSRVNQNRPSLAYSVTFGVKVPDYEIEKTLWPDEHYEGGYLFRNALMVELVPPQVEGADWNVRYAWQDQAVQPADTPIGTKQLKNGKVEVSIPFDSGKSPGVTGRLRFLLSAWNEPEADA